MVETSNIGKVLEERGNRYGEFSDHAIISQTLKSVCHNHVKAVITNYSSLAPDQQEAIDMICHKLARILNGDPNYADSWIDIAGYAKLISDRLEREQNESN